MVTEDGAELTGDKYLLANGASVTDLLAARAPLGMQRVFTELAFPLKSEP